MRHYRTLLFVALLLVPIPAAAAEINAGFPPQSIWASRTTAVAGDTLDIFTVIHNGSTDTLKGVIVFRSDDTRIAVKNFTLAAGTSELVSIEWEAVRGEHNVSALIEDVSMEGTGGSVVLAQQTSDSIKITVSEPPPPPAIVNAATEASDFIADTAKAATPVVQDAFNTVYTKTEEFRERSIDRLEAYLGSPKASTVLGASSTDVGARNLASTATGFNAPQNDSPSILSKLKQTAAAAALFSLKSKPIFYILILVSLFGVLYVLFRWAFKRPKFRS